MELTKKCIGFVIEINVNEVHFKVLASVSLNKSNQFDENTKDLIKQRRNDHWYSSNQ